MARHRVPVARTTRNTEIAGIIILRLIITVETDIIMVETNNLIIHQVATTNTNNELKKTTRIHT